MVIWMKLLRLIVLNRLFVGSNFVASPDKVIIDSSLSIIN
jgi:hypothetical protein